MKKNLRMVSAAAAALISVAPIVGTAISQSPMITQAATIYSNKNLGTGDASSAANAIVIQQADGNNVSVSYSDATNSTALAKALNGVKLVAQQSGAGQPIQNLTAKDAKVVSVNGGKGVHIGKNSAVVEFTVSGMKMIQSNNYYQGDANGDKAPSQGVSEKNPTQTVKVNVSFNVTNSNGYFADANNTMANGKTIYASASQNAKLFGTGESVTIAQIKSAISGDILSRSSFVWNDQVFGHGNATTDGNLISQLRNQGIKVEGSGDSAKATFTNKPVTLTIRANSGDEVRVVLQNANVAADKNAPVIVVNNGSSWVPVQGATASPIFVTQNDNGKFDMQNYARAYASANQPAFIGASYEGKVDVTKTGIYYVTVKATNLAGKTTSVVVPVIVTDSNGRFMTTTSNADVYTINNGVATKVDGFNSQIASGTSVKVFGSMTTAKLDGQDTNFYRISGPNANYFVKASALKDGEPAKPAEQTTKMTIMHIAAIYDKNGKKTSASELRAYDVYDFVTEPVTINGAKFYKLAGKDAYIKVGNIDGTQRKLRHNSYIYKSNGKIYTKKSGKKTKKIVKKAGSEVTTYGSAMKHGKFYRVGRNQYIKKANF